MMSQIQKNYYLPCYLLLLFLCIVSISLTLYDLFLTLYDLLFDIVCVL